LTLCFFALPPPPAEVSGFGFRQQETRNWGFIVDQITHRFIETNGIRMHLAERGEGPLAVLCHGFPELGYSWRYQLVALARAGFHAVAPDQRGYGQTDRPAPVEAYDIFQLTGDIVGLVNALGEDRAVIIGHDWGSVVAYHCASFARSYFPPWPFSASPFCPGRAEKFLRRKS